MREAVSVRSDPWRSQEDFIREGMLWGVGGEGDSWNYPNWDIMGWSQKPTQIPQRESLSLESLSVKNRVASAHHILQ